MTVPDPHKKASRFDLGKACAPLLVSISNYLSVLLTNHSTHLLIRKLEQWLQRSGCLLRVSCIRGQAWFHAEHLFGQVQLHVGGPHGVAVPVCGLRDKWECEHDRYVASIKDEMKAWKRADAGLLERSAFAAQ